MKPLDFVKTAKGSVGMITEVSQGSGVLLASVEFLRSFQGEKNAWWNADDLEIIDNLPDLLSRNLRNPFGSNSVQPYWQEVKHGTL